MSLTPREIPEGAIRYNTDSNKMEVWIGDKWMQVAVSTPNLDGGTRGFFMGGGEPAEVNRIEFVNIATAGNAADFGDLTKARMENSAFSSKTRAITAGDSVPGSDDTIDVFTMSSTGNAVDFGNLLSATNNMQGQGALSNATRGIFGGGYQAAPVSAGHNVMQFVTISSNGNALDFGDLPGSGSFSGVTGGSSPTRGLWFGGGPSGGTNSIVFVTIASTGNTQDFADKTDADGHGTTASNPVRILYFTGNGLTNLIEYVTTATFGNAMDFGDMTITTRYAATSSSSPTRGVVGGGGYPNRTNVIDYNQIMTQGNSVDFGDLVTERFLCTRGCVSTGHGGL